jgi:hypothetical protein
MTLKVDEPRRVASYNPYASQHESSATARIAPGAAIRFCATAQGLFKTNRMLMSVDWVNPRDVMVREAFYGSQNIFVGYDGLPSIFFLDRIPTQEQAEAGDAWDDGRPLEYPDLEPGFTVSIMVENRSASVALVSMALLGDIGWPSQTLIEGTEPNYPQAKRIGKRPGGAYG